VIEGYYYLHTESKDLIYKREFGGTKGDLMDSPFVDGIWPCDLTNRGNAWEILIEALSAGAKKKRIQELAEKWGCTDNDAIIYADRYGVVLGKDGNQFTATRKDFTNLQECPCGFGDTYLEAMADLCKQLGYVPFKTWGNKFSDLLK
jgi:hypothetical protein